MKRTLPWFALTLLALGSARSWTTAGEDKPWVVYEGKDLRLR